MLKSTLLILSLMLASIQAGTLTFTPSMVGNGVGLTNLNINGLASTNNVLTAPRVVITNATAPINIWSTPDASDLGLLHFQVQSGDADVGGFDWMLTDGFLQLSLDRIHGQAFGGNISFNDGEIDADTAIVAPAFAGNGAALSSLDAGNITTGLVSANRISLYTQGGANLMGGNYTMTITSTDILGGNGLTIPVSSTGIYVVMGTVIVKYVGATYASAQTMTFKWRRTNNTPGDIATGLPVELPVLTTFTGGDTIAMPSIPFNATAGDVITIFGVLSAAPAAGSVQVTAAGMTVFRLQ